MNAFIVKTKILPSAKNGGVLRSVTKICCSNQLCNNCGFFGILVMGISKQRNGVMRTDKQRMMA